MNDITRLLGAIQQGESRAADELLPLVYEELRGLAAARMARERPGQTLQPTALVHEAWLRVAGSGNPQFEGRGHFYAAAAEAMRRILIDRARRKAAQRHGGGQQRADLDEMEIGMPVEDPRLLEINEALDRFAAIDPQKAELVKLRYFVGLSIPEAAEVLGISEPTAKRWWAYARAWLFEAIDHEG
ncbi:MAG: sigma-70 family RNA polymerase sigma factor [Verrucomicrobiota bacterium]